MIRVECVSRKYRDENDDLAGKTVLDIYESFKGILQIPERDNNLAIKVNNSDAELCDTVDAGDVVEFMKKAGDKGVTVRS